MEEEEGFPSTLFNKIQNPLNDKEYGISVIPDGRITIYDSFIEQLKTAPEHDRRAKNLNSLLERTGVAQHLSEQKDYQHCIPKEILVGEDLDIGMEDQKVLKFKNCFGLGLEETKKGKFLKEIHPDMKFTSKEEMKEFFQKIIWETRKENTENKAQLAQNEESIKGLGSQLEASKASEAVLEVQHVKDEEIIAQHLQEKQSLAKLLEDLTTSKEELEKKAAEQLQENEALTLSLKTTKEKVLETINKLTESLSTEVK